MSEQNEQVPVEDDVFEEDSQAVPSNSHDLVLYTKEQVDEKYGALERMVEAGILQHSIFHCVPTVIDPHMQRMLKVLRKSMRHVLKLQRLQHKLDRENNTYVEMTEKALKSLEKEQLSIQELEEQIIHDQHELVAGQGRLQEQKEIVKTLRKEIVDLSNAIKEGVQLSSEQQEALQELVEYKNRLTLDLDEEMKRIVLLRSSVSDTYEKLKAVDYDRQVLEVEIIQLKQKDALKKIDIDRETRHRDALDKELKQLRANINVKQQECKAKEEFKSKLAEDNTLLEINLNGQLQLIAQFTKERDATLLRIQRIMDETRENQTCIYRLEQENAMIERGVKERMHHHTSHRAELKRQINAKEEIYSKVQQLENAKLEYEEERRILKEQNDEFAESLETLRRQLEQKKKLLEDANRERNWIKSLHQKSSLNGKRAADTVMILQQMKHNLELELNQQLGVITSLKDKTAKITEERELVLQESVQVQQNYLTAIKELKAKEVQLYDYRKKMTDVERKLKHQQALYEAVQNDRNIYSKHLMDSQNDIHQMKRKLKTMTYQINNYKEEIKSKTANLNRAHSENGKLNQDIKAIQEEIKQLEHQNELSQAYLRKQSYEETKLIQFVKAADLERTKQEHALKVLMGERDNLATQIIRQQAELTHVYDRLRVLHSTARNTDSGLCATTGTLSKCRKRMLHMQRKCIKYKLETCEFKTVDHLKTQLEYEMMIETMKYNTIQRESIMPLNVHRWRQLESTNPKLFEMIQMASGLQKRLIIKREEEMRKENEIEETEKMYLQLKSLQASQWTEENGREQMQHLKHLLKDKKTLLTNLTIQLQMYKAQTRENEYLQKQVEDAIFRVKKKYVKSKLNQTNGPANVQNSMPNQGVVPAGKGGMDLAIEANH